MTQKRIQNRDSEVRNMQPSSDMVERVARALADVCHCGACTYEDRIEDAQAALEASHHASIVAENARLRAVLQGVSDLADKALSELDEALAKIGGDR
jgi:hypothetical protein